MSNELTDEEKQLEDVILHRMMRLNANIYGLTLGLILGIGLFFATIWLVVKGGPVVGPNLSLLGNFFIGYQVSIKGAFIGFFYGLLTGFIFGYLIASIYNWIVDFRTNRK
jgi:hypothetical protein